MVEELLEKIPPEKRWAMTAETLKRFEISLTVKTGIPFLGKEKGILSLLAGREMMEEIKEKVYSEGARKMFPLVKETFNIPVENAIEAAKLETVVATLINGPEQENEYLEATPERVLLRITRCAAWERFKEHEIDPEFLPCPAACQPWGEEGLKAIDPKITRKLTKSIAWGDPYCEAVIEFKEV